MEEHDLNFSVIDVRSVGSHVFCPRAGVIAYKQQGVRDDDSGEEESRIPNLGFLPAFSEEELEERFHVIIPTLRRYGIATLIGLLVVYLISQFFSFSLSVLLLVALLPVGYKTLDEVFNLIAVLAELGRYKHARQECLDPTVKTPINISWYGLVKSGYKPIKPKARLEDQELPLVGWPWRVLTDKDGHWLPVINFTGERMELRDSHRTRLALYSHLIESVMDGTKSDWGILLDVRTKQCIALPIDDHARARAKTTYHQFSQSLEEDRQGRPPRNQAGAPCERCRFGKPRDFISGVSETQFESGPIGAFTQTGHAGQLVHSDCGDKFKGRPHHHYWTVKR